MDVARDLLDKKVVDRNGRELGRVDGLIVNQGAGQPPEIVALEIGPAVLAERVSPTLGRWVAALEHACGIAEGRPFRVPVDTILDVTTHVKVDVAFSQTPAATVEQRVRRWLSLLPGGS